MAGNQNANWIIFVDTNVFLDFYRQPGDYATRQLGALERHKDSLIICEQVWMEFLKNRQKAILSGIEKMSAPKQVLNVPPILLDTQPKKMAEKHFAKTAQNYKKMEKKIAEILTEPQMYDPVYKSVKRLFKSNSKFNLKRPNQIRFQIREKAEKRFKLGYPPRKNADSSIGDAYNWEWILHCARSDRNNYNVLIVSRDGDFGSTYKKNSLINDWLWQEFRDRVGRKHSIELTTKLSDALRKLDEAVVPEDEEIEEETLSRNFKDLQDSSKTHPHRKYPTLSSFAANQSTVTEDEFIAWFRALMGEEPRAHSIEEDQE